MLQNSDIEGLYFVNETLDVGKIIYLRESGIMEFKLVVDGRYHQP